jgi:hypothetical protein
MLLIRILLVERNSNNYRGPELSEFEYRRIIGIYNNSTKKNNYPKILRSFTFYGIRYYFQEQIAHEQQIFTMI